MILVEQKSVVSGYGLLGGGFKYFLFSPLVGEDSQFDEYFSDGLKPPTSLCFFIVWGIPFQKSSQYFFGKGLEGKSESVS